MKQKQQTINKKTLEITNNHKDLQQLQQAWEKTAQKLKNSSSQEDQMLYSFLEANYIDPHTHLIASKKKQESRSISCKAKYFRHSNQAR